MQPSAIGCLLTSCGYRRAAWKVISPVRGLSSSGLFRPALARGLMVPGHHRRGEIDLISREDFAESQPLPAAEAYGFLTPRGGNRRTGRPPEDGPCSTGSHAQHAPLPALTPSVSAGPAGTVHKRRLDIGTPCSHHGAQAMPQEAQSGTQLMLNPAGRLLNLPGDFGFCKAFYNRECQQLALGPGKAAD